MTTHIHHIIPKHMGGTDDPENLIELRVAEHAEAHRLLFEKFGRIEDKLAWLGLAGLVNKEDIVHAILTRPKSEEHKEKLRKPKKNTVNYLNNTNAKGNAGKPKSESHRKNISDAKKGQSRNDMIGNDYAKALKGKKKSQEHVAKVTASLNTVENKKKRSDGIKASWDNRESLKCPHCGLESKNAANMKRYHFNNCKKNNNE
jgi:hypothetical protein